jgi:hypothetical protein
MDACGNLHADRAVHKGGLSLGVILQRTQVDLALNTVDGILHRNFDGSMVVLAPRLVVATARRQLLGVAKHGREELAEIGMVNRALTRATVQFKASVPVLEFHQNGMRRI